MTEVESIIGTSREAKERREQRQTPVRRLEQVIEAQRHRDVEHVRDEVDGVI